MATTTTNGDRAVDPTGEEARTMASMLADPSKKCTAILVAN
jgi:hypothetical protein